MKSFLHNGILQKAVEDLQKGNLLDAKVKIAEILRADSKNFDALHIMGVIHGVENNHIKALHYLNKAIKLNPKNNFVNFNLAKALSENGKDFEALKYHEKAVSLSENHVEAWLNFGKSLFKLGRNNDALIHYDQAIKLRPDYPEAWLNKGITLNELKLYEDALMHFSQAIQQRPEYAEAWFNSAVTFDELKLYEDALAHYDRAIELNPEYVEAWINKGITLNKLKCYDEALASYDRAIELSPGYAEAWINKGITLNELKIYVNALENYNKAIELRPHCFKTLVNKGVTLNELCLYDEALIHYDQAIKINPRYAEAWLNKGVTLKELKRYEEALVHYDKALEIRPEYAEASYYSGLTNLFLKKFDIGWKGYELRLKNNPIINFEFPIDVNILPVWTGELMCQHLLVISEQGVGDEIFYINFLKYVVPKVKKITVIVDLRLIPIFSRSFPEIIFIERGAGLNVDLYDYQVAIASFPEILKLEPLLSTSIHQPFLIDNHELTNNVKSSEIFSEKFNCGISWRSSNEKIGLSKSISLVELKDVLQTPNCNFVNLQYGDVVKELEEAGSLIGEKIVSVNNIDVFHNIDGLLSIIKACDVIITTSNITAHLAGAIGKKTFLLLPYSRGRIWYWHEENISTWYPCINQYYQSADLSWGAAIKEVAQMLGDEIVRKN